MLLLRLDAVRSTTSPTDGDYDTDPGGDPNQRSLVRERITVFDMAVAWSSSIQIDRCHQP